MLQITVIYQNIISPVQFGNGKYAECVPNPFYQDNFAKFKSFEEYDKQIHIQEIDDFVVIYERHIGNYIELGKNWRDFIEKYKEHLKKDTLLIERSYADPSVASIDKCLYDICIIVDKNCSFNNVTTIQGGKFAVYRFEGEVKDIFIVFQGLFNVWLANSCYEMDKRCGLDIYRTINWEDMQVVMDLCIPIK